VDTFYHLKESMPRDFFGVIDTGGKFAAYTGGKPLSTTLVKLVAKFAAGVVDTSGQP